MRTLFRLDFHPNPEIPQREFHFFSTKVSSHWGKVSTVVPPAWTESIQLGRKTAVTLWGSQGHRKEQLSTGTLHCKKAKSKSSQKEHIAPICYAYTSSATIIAASDYLLINCWLGKQLENLYNCTSTTISLAVPSSSSVTTWYSCREAAFEKALDFTFGPQELTRAWRCPLLSDMLRWEWTYLLESDVSSFITHLINSWRKGI